MLNTIDLSKLRFAQRQACAFQHSKYLWPESDVTLSFTEFTKIAASACVQIQSQQSSHVILLPALVLGYCVDILTSVKSHADFHATSHTRTTGMQL